MVPDLPLPTKIVLHLPQVLSNYIAEVQRLSTLVNPYHNCIYHCVERKNKLVSNMAALRQSPRIAAYKKKQQGQGKHQQEKLPQESKQPTNIVSVTKRWRCTRVGEKNIHVMTDKITHRRGGISKKTLLIKSIPIKDLIGPLSERHSEKDPRTLPNDVLKVDETYRSSSMSNDNIYSFWDRITHYRDGTTRKTLAIRTTPVEDLIGPGPDKQ